jgi:hypothetical protein
MSAADDVSEMQSLAEYIAERLSISKKDKDRTKALYTAFNPELHRGNEMVSWNRCFEFLKGKARIVQSWEKDLARAKRDAIKAAERQRRTQEHIAWLRSIHDGAAQAGADMDRADLAAVERVLSRIGALGSTLGDTGAAGFTDADNRHDQSEGWGH